MSLHAQEALAGALLSEPPRSRTAAGTALSSLAEARARGVTGDRAVAAHPVVLALTAPSLNGHGQLPRIPAPAPAPAATPVRYDGTPAAPAPEGPLRPGAPVLPPREALRLRIRWVQELQVRLVREVARRLGLGPERTVLLRWRELAAALEGGTLPAGLHARVKRTASPPLPDLFRLAEGEVVVAEHRDTGGDGGRGVSGGRAVGTVWNGTGPRPDDPVLVVRTLDPALAPLLPGLTGLVAQTGSPFSHLAVLAREFGLPAVVGAADAVRRFPSGSRLTLDGITGDVRLGETP